MNFLYVGKRHKSKIQEVEKNPKQTQEKLEEIHTKTHNNQTSQTKDKENS